MTREIEKLYTILASFLGESKSVFDDSNFQYQFACPRCVERDGQNEARKYNLEVNIQKQVFKCWKCSSMDDDMHGSIVKLIRMYGNETLLAEYKDVIRYGKIVVGDNSFIGLNVTILPNVTIGENSVIGACSLVCKDVEPNSVYAGVPARRICSIEEYAEKCLRETPEYDKAKYKENKKEEVLRALAKMEKYDD